MLTTQNQIIQANLRLVISVAKRYVGPHAESFEQVSDGNDSLMRAVNKFDYTRGFKFSTYATWALKMNYARAYANQKRHTDRFRTSQDEALASTRDFRADPVTRENTHSRAKALVARILEQLDPREQQNVALRFGLGESREPQTLLQVGGELGVSKERVRQIEARAFNKLREAAISEKTRIRP
jgi:RNA polymerase primary sigma factor/RNA polymerase sigma factor